jgi:hypothetical protein
MRGIFVGSLTSLAIALVSSPAPASAATLITGAGVCNQTSTALPTSSAGNYSACVAYSGNLLNQNSIADINTALDVLAGGNYSPDVVWSALEPTESLVSGSGNDPTGLITFTQALTGNVILGVHFGGANSGADERTQFYAFNFAAPTSQLYLNTQGFSVAVVIPGVGGVPEPATWALMLLGFAGIGLAMRWRTKVDHSTKTAGYN